MSRPAHDVISTSANQTPALRSSGRIRRRPALYSDASNKTARRKKAGKAQNAGDHSNADGNDDQDDEEAESDEEDDDDDDKDADSDAEEPDTTEVSDRRQRKRKLGTATHRKPAAKRPKTEVLPLRGAKQATRKTQLLRLPAVDLTSNESMPPLFKAIFVDRNDFQDLAAQWALDYDVDQPKALAEVVNLVLRCAGCDGIVNEHDILDTDGVISKLDDLRDEFQASNPTDYPLIAKGKLATLTRQGISGFLSAFIKTMAANHVLYQEPSLIENMHNWLSTMSSAPNRPFRHTATVASLSLATTLTEVARDNSAESAMDRRHAETEKAKARPNKARVKQLEDKFKAKAEFQSLLESFIKDLFDTVFIHRYRDVDPLIRRDCVAALGDWVNLLPDMFLNGSHLRYFGWVLSDVAAATRGEVIRQLLRLYREKQMLAGLKTFTEKFRSRLVEIATTDADAGVRILGIELLEHLRESGLLEPNDIDDVGRLVFDSDAKIRRAVSRFFANNVQDLYNSKLDDLGGHEGVIEALPAADEDRFDNPKPDWLMFKSIAEMLQSYDNDEHLPIQAERARSDGRIIVHLASVSSRFELAADVLYDHLEQIRDWQSLAGYLLFDHITDHDSEDAESMITRVKQGSALGDGEETILLDVLSASLGRCLSGLSSSIEGTKKPMSKKEKAAHLDQQEETTTNLITLIPQLLKKYGDTPTSAAAILKIEGFLSLPTLSTFPHDTVASASLLEHVKKQFMNHSSDDVLGPATAAILHAKSYGELDDVTDEKLSELWEDVVRNLTQIVDDSTTQRGGDSVDTLHALSNNLLRLIRLSTISDCTEVLEQKDYASSKVGSDTNETSPIDVLITLTKRGCCHEGDFAAEELILHDQISTRAAEATLFYFRWAIKSIASRVSDVQSHGIPFEELEELARRRDAYVEALKSILLMRKSTASISASIAELALETHSSMAVLQHLQPRKGVSDDYIVLVLNCDAELQRAIMKVFNAVEKNFARWVGKKLQDGNSRDAEVPEVEEDGLDDEPVSDSDFESGGHHDSNRTIPQEDREGRLLQTMLAEQRLCALTGKIIQAVFANVIDGRAARRRLNRNKTRLGPNYKECISFLDTQDQTRPAHKTKARNSTKTRRGDAPKSAPIVLDEDEIDDSDEDDHDNSDGPDANGSLIEEIEHDDTAQENGNGDDIESMLGD